jgi:surface antigen
MASRSQAIFHLLRFQTCAWKTVLKMVKIWVPIAITAALAGCSMTFPMSPLLVPGSKEDLVGEVPARPLVSMLDAEDWPRAKAALSTALDSHGNDSLVGWDNPDSGNKGSFAPVGKAYPSDAKICRVFLAKVDRKGDEQSLQGTACADQQGEWTITEAKPQNKT